MVKIEDGNEGAGEDILQEAEAIVEEAAEEVAKETKKAKGAAKAAPKAKAANAAEEGQEAEGEEAESAEAGQATESEPQELSTEEQLAAAQEEVADWQGKFMRLHAEWDTYRRRTNEQRAEEKLRATEGLVENLLPVIDDFERSIGYADENGEEGLLDGIKQVHTKLVEVLTKNGVEVIDPVGEAFDALEAQAVAKVEDASQPDETVAEVYQKGYRMGKKVIRPAMVTVTTCGPAREPEEVESSEDTQDQ